MRAVAQRVRKAWVNVDGETVGQIEAGLIVYLGAAHGDGPTDVDYVANKLANLRVFEGDDGRMTLSVQEVAGSILLVSQFTLFGDVRRGRRPSFEGAAEPEMARALYESAADALRKHGLRVETGRFRAHMDVHAHVDGPVTILIDSTKLF
jgi:D-aminoacyl-tRNA deacylase